MQWTDFFTAIGLMLVIEGIIPFVRPSLARSVHKTLMAFADRDFRLAGFFSMIAGLVVLYFVR